MKNLLRILAVVMIVSIVPSCAQDEMDEINAEIQDQEYLTGSGKSVIEKPGGSQE